MVLGIQFATKILLSMDASALEDVELAFQAPDIYMLASCLLWGGPPIEACNGLEQALSRFRRHRVVVETRPRKRRTISWSAAIQNAFGNSDVRELFVYMPLSSKSAHFISRQLSATITNF